MNSHPAAFPNSSWCLASPLWLLLSAESFKAALPRAGGAGHLPRVATRCCFSPCIAQAPWVLCAASSLASPMAWGVGVDGKDMGAWEECGCPTVTATGGSAGAGQEQGKAPPAREFWELLLQVSGLCPAPGGVSLRLHRRGEPDKP